MAPITSSSPKYGPDGKLVKKPVSWSNLAVGAGLNIFEVSTLGQPFEGASCFGFNFIRNFTMGINFILRKAKCSIRIDTQL